MARYIDDDEIGYGFRTFFIDRPRKLSGGRTDNNRSGMVEVKAGAGRKLKSFWIPVRDPVVKLRVVPGSGTAFPGETIRVPLWIVYEEGDPDRIRVDVLIDDEKIGSYDLGRKTESKLTVQVGPGVHEVRVHEPLSRTVVRGVLKVDRARPSVRVAGVEGRIEYPRGGSVFLVLSVEPSSSRISGVEVVNVSGASVRVERVVDNRVGLVVVDPSPVFSARFTLRVFIDSVDGVRDVVEVDTEIPVVLSEDHARAWERKILEMLESMNSSALTEWINRARSLLEECKSTVGRLGFDCSRLEEALDKAREELMMFGKKLDKAIELASKNNYSEAVELLLDILKSCETTRYRDSETCELIGEKIQEVLNNAAGFIEELYKESNYDDILAATDYLLRLCQLEVPGTGRSCGIIERTRSLVESIAKLLGETIELKVPEHHASRIIRGKIRVSYSEGSEVLDGVRIDFTPASGYIRIDPKPVVELPRLIPGSDFIVEIVMESLVKGRVPIPYKVCHSNYCVEKITYTAVGMPIASVGVLSKSIEDYVGRAVYGLRSLKPEQLRPRRVSKPFKLGEYTCSGILGEGGYAIALLCSDSAGINVVVKLPFEALPLLYGSEFDTVRYSLMKRHVEAFDREAKILSRLSHPNIIKVLDHGVEPMPYLAFEFCEYGDLKRLVSKVGKLDVKTALEIMIPIGAALAYGHEQRVLHLDVKPSNILITRELIPKLSDYNIAKAMATISARSRSKLEGGGYTPGFGAPEQLNPALPKPGPYSDIFSHAATLYYLITGTYPYPLEEWRTSLFRDDHKPTPVSKHVTGIPRDLDLVLGEALAIHPNERPQSMREYIQQLVEIHARL